MSKDKDFIHIKSNGLRNELKEIRKSIDKLTDAMIEIVDIMAQTHKHDEENNHINSSTSYNDSELWNTTSTNEFTKEKV